MSDKEAELPAISGLDRRRDIKAEGAILKWPEKPLDDPAARPDETVIGRADGQDSRTALPAHYRLRRSFTRDALHPHRPAGGGNEDRDALHLRYTFVVGSPISR